MPTPTQPSPASAPAADVHGAYPRLTDDQVAILRSCGQQRQVREGDHLFRAGERSEDFFVVLSGTVAVVERHDDQEHVVQLHGPHSFLGELGLLEGQTAFVSAVVHSPGEVLAVGSAALRDVLSREPALGDVILRAYLLRRTMLAGAGTGFRIVGSAFSADTRRLLEFAARNRLPHRWSDLEKDAEAEALLTRLGISPEETPVVVLHDCRVLRNPSNAELAQVVGLRHETAEKAVCDLLVVGAGPGGLAAAVNGACEGLSTVVLDAEATGGQAGTSSRIENYLGFPAGISGGELAERAVVQADRFGARIDVPAEAAGLEQHDGTSVVRLADGGTVTATNVVVATGARYRRLTAPGIERFEGVGVHYAATVWEARTCRFDPVAVVGGGNSAGQAALFLAAQSPAVHLLVRGADLEHSMSRYLIDRIERHPRIDVRLHTEVREVTGEDRVESVVVEDNRTHQRQVLAARALFVFIGARPATSWLAEALPLDRRGFIPTGPEVADTSADLWKRLGRAPLALEAGLPGVFAVGDVRSGSVKRVASAVGEGAMAVRLAHEHLGEVGPPAVR
ncbi:FAD-dependent oxidoreductase [Actinacidiphila paucisporea]|uniref:Thioredoxin reductase (NADPH) n=1 Tax=Actinacidiphila paucisporea TaxID=310782 RepID=A0A1M7QB15_9ACTN|nr:cyclic nucleotide-binding domain-containing thioredoxin-disulfide reductase [Actinacidiphila paucisporea]SHN27591.1 thioredoxin reductase (NADPH) [Actinacidiphila paucisporea]